MFDNIAKSLLKPINPSVIIILGVYTVIWGLWILSPFWSVFSTATIYSAMHQIGSEFFWGAAAVFCGAITIRGAVKPSYPNLKMGSFIGFFHWLVIGILFFMGDAAATGGITALTFATYSALVWVNIKVNKTHYINRTHRMERK